MPAIYIVDATGKGLANSLGNVGCCIRLILIIVTVCLCYTAYQEYNNCTDTKSPTKLAYTPKYRNNYKAVEANDSPNNCSGPKVSNISFKVTSIHRQYSGSQTSKYIGIIKEKNCYNCNSKVWRVPVGFTIPKQ